MNLTTILAECRIADYKKNYFEMLLVEKHLSEKLFNWITFNINGKILEGNGILTIGGKSYKVEIKYSPFIQDIIKRFDHIKITNIGLKYNADIHVYGDLSLCLYHPKIDKPEFGFIPLYKIIPWISEWCVHYEEWKKYGVWLGREIKH